MLPTSAARADTVNTGELYERNRQRLIEIIRAASPDELEWKVPPTPAWRVRDVLAHVVGITADLNALNFGQGDADAWTRNQVESRRSASIEAIVSEWDREAPRFEEGMRLLGYSVGSHYVGDLFAHVQDLCMTLGSAAEPDLETVLVALDFYLESLDEGLRASGIGAVEVIAGDEHHVAGPGSPIASVSGGPFEILRALSGRRSLGQIRSLDWTGDADSLAPEMSRYPLPVVDLVD